MHRSFNVTRFARIAACAALTLTASALSLGGAVVAVVS